MDELSESFVFVINLRFQLRSSNTMNGLVSLQTQNTSISETFSSWQIPPANLKLKANEVHIWFAQLDQGNIAEFEQIISGRNLEPLPDPRIASAKD